MIHHSKRIASAVNFYLGWQERENVGQLEHWLGLRRQLNSVLYFSRINVFGSTPSSMRRSDCSGVRLVFIIILSTLYAISGIQHINIAVVA